MNKIFLEKRKGTSHPFLVKNVDEKRKAISPLIAVILIIVVAVALIAIILNWGKSFTTESLSQTQNIADLKVNDASNFIFKSELKGDLLTFTYSPPLNLKNKTIDVNAYTVVGFDNIKYLSSPVTLREGTVGIKGVNVASYGVSGGLFDLVLITTNNEIIAVNKTSYVDTLANLPYVMHGRSRLYINTVNRTGPTNWATAVSYCDTLEAHGYSDWYLPSAAQMMSIWLACPLQAKTTTCMHNNIQNKITGWSNLVNSSYWTSTEYNSSNAYIFAMGYGDIYAYTKTYTGPVRCVRDH